jgi:threonine synthase
VPVQSVERKLAAISAADIAGGAVRPPACHGSSQQAANCATVTAAWDDNRDFTPRPTIDDGIAVVKPVRTAEVLAALRRSQGEVVAVPDDEVARSLIQLGRLGLYVEPISATVGAVLSRPLAQGAIRPEDTTIAIVTGHALKGADKLGELLESMFP